MPHMLSRIRPVGNRINFSVDELNLNNFKPYEVDFYQSGTAALAAAIMAAVKNKPGFSSAPEIFIPAYGCPDLVSAILYAGAKPVLIDLEPNLPWMSLSHIIENISENTAAIVAVNFLGIPERMEQLQNICNNHDLTLIEDSAQGFPKNEPESYWKGDYAILSFGRGKPVNMLRGGAVLSKNTDLKNLLPAPDRACKDGNKLIKYFILAGVYNIVINPLLYGIISRLPGLHIGETNYKPLDGLTTIQKHILSRLPSNIKSYIESPTITGKLKEILSKYQDDLIDDLVSTTQHTLLKPLLRYPILVNNKHTRDAMHKKLTPLGASTMYQQPLHMIPGIAELIEIDHDAPNATDFANRLMTLPTHSGITDSILSKIDKSLLSLSKGCR